MSAVEIPASHRDLVDAAGVASLSTIGANGYPQVTAIWYLAEGDTLATSLTLGRQKTKNLLRDPHATLFFIDPTNPFRTLEIRGDVTITHDDADLSFLHKIFGHYGANPEAAGVPLADRVVARLTPVRVITNG
ncbi:PPOX class F420-dependent oxidoreductase [Millisia brevis]|uniref:PPOX class F420-dependent oxidoreductase n=1 Tax=Millisia brevis TaxID=264148 RepID=UPI0008356B16|nr:PPOX class F420-dependent oxidoreductase [Millisia brevis]